MHVTLYIGQYLTLTIIRCWKNYGKQSLRHNLVMFCVEDLLINELQFMGLFVGRSRCSSIT